MKRTQKEIKQQTEEWLDERWMIANMKDTRPQDMSYYMGALKALEFVGYEWKRNTDGKHTLFKQIGAMEMKNIFVIDKTTKCNLGILDFTPRKEIEVVVECVLYEPLEHATLVFVSIVEPYYTAIAKEIKW